MKIVHNVLKKNFITNFHNILINVVRMNSSELIFTNIDIGIDEYTSPFSFGQIFNQSDHQ